MLKESVVTCVACDVSIPRHLTYLFDNKKYPSFQHWQKVTIPQKYTKRYICKTCHEQLRPQFICVCCDQEVDKHLCILYVKDNYDFTQYVVSQCLCKISNNDEETWYICKSCDRRLQETSSENPVLPYYGNHKKVASGANFLKSLQEMPTYVCTCCHHLMFHKNVRPFNISEYDMNHEIIKKVYHIDM